MQIDVVTLFPELVSVPMGLSMMGRAQEKGILDLRVHDLREQGLGKHRHVDDTPYGGGQGMVIRPEPVFATLDRLDTPEARVIYLSPAGKRFDQATARRLSAEPHLIFLSGHYEGVDHRIIEHWVDEASLEQHISAEALRRTVGEAMALTDGPPQGTRYRLV